MGQTLRILEVWGSARHGLRVLPLAMLLACAADGGTPMASSSRPGRPTGQPAAIGGTPATAPGTTTATTPTAPNVTGPVAGNGAANPATVLLTVGGSGPMGAGLEEKGCKGLQCQQHACPSGSATTITGRVFDPAGKNPIYNVAVYVPNEAVKPLKKGASCDTCDMMYTGKAVVSSLTDANGQFKLEKAPDGANIPLVIQIGKWRRQFTIPSVAQCQETRLPEKMLTMPKNGKEGDMPNIAIATGAADTLECLLRRVGVDASEYMPGAGGDGHIHIFQGSRGAGAGATGGTSLREAPNTSPAAGAASTSLWMSKDELMKYDVVLLSCEGQETQNMNQQALHDYAAAGGRVFASHFHYAWFNSGPYASEELAAWTPGAQNIGDIEGSIVTSFPKGEALKQWLGNTSALVNGELPIQEARHNADVSSVHSASQPWILASQASKAPGATQYFSFNTPTDQARVPDGKVCGRVVFSDLHVGAASHDDSLMPVPVGCKNADLSPQEKALEFMLFDLSACVIPDDVPPAPPPALN